MSKNYRDPAAKASHPLLPLTEGRRQQWDDAES